MKGLIQSVVMVTIIFNVVRGRLLLVETEKEETHKESSGTINKKYRYCDINILKPA